MRLAKIQEVAAGIWILTETNEEIELSAALGD
jgi:hypothetical protein